MFCCVGGRCSSFEQAKVCDSSRRLFWTHHNWQNNLTEGFQVNTIIINDLTPFLNGRKVLLKTDIERSECHVTQNADKIFADVGILAIIMEIGATVKEGPCCFESMLLFF